ncbi:MAG: hypothetical protein C4530_21490 [Desulfobacteraceae bacterium]|nr:MAG: hypothetical protein C4530_21490 [Desulfobacteraceae bacterium]
MPAWFYILRLQSGSLYVGATSNLENRYAAHCAGSASRTTALDPHKSERGMLRWQPYGRPSPTPGIRRTWAVP